jgi:hypothetical protein
LQARPVNRPDLTRYRLFSYDPHYADPPISLKCASPPIPHASAVLPLHSPLRATTNPAPRRVPIATAAYPVALVLRPYHAWLLAPGRPLPARAHPCAAARPRPHWPSPHGITATTRTSRLQTRVIPNQLGTQSLPPEPTSCRPPHLARSCINGCAMLVPPNRTGQRLASAPGCALHLKATPPYLLSSAAATIVRR